MFKVLSGQRCLPSFFVCPSKVVVKIGIVGHLILFLLAHCFLKKCDCQRVHTFPVINPPKSVGNAR